MCFSDASWNGASALLAVDYTPDPSGTIGAWHGAAPKRYGDRTCPTDGDGRHAIQAGATRVPNAARRNPRSRRIRGRVGQRSPESRMIAVRLEDGTTIYAFGSFSVFARSATGAPDRYWQDVADSALASAGGDLKTALLSLPGAKLIQDGAVNPADRPAGRAGAHVPDRSAHARKQAGRR